MDNPEDYFAVHVPSPDGRASSEGAVFRSLKEASSFANSPESKARGARFKRFRSPDDARNYAEKGDMFCKKSETPGNEIVSEPSVSFPSVSRIMMNRLKKSIETKDDDVFLGLVSQNPRYLINVSSDTPTIVVEGFRYNALHLAAKCGNVYVARYVLHFVCDNKALLTLYDTSEADVQMRSRLLLDCYLNMPDKGSHDTPLHFASKFGHLQVVQLLLSYSVCQKNPVNKMGATPSQVCCTRYNGDDKEDLCAAMLSLFSAFYVALYRPIDDYYSLTIRVFEDMPPGLLPDSELQPRAHKLAFEMCELSAYAGPFASEEQAQKFSQTWAMEERDCRRSHPRKGAERVGRRLACDSGVKFLERWSFTDKLIDLNSYEGLEELNRYLVHIRLHSSPSVSSAPTFDDEDDTSLFADASESVDVVDSKPHDFLFSALTEKLATLHLDRDIEEDNSNEDPAATSSVTLPSSADVPEIDPEPLDIRDDDSVVSFDYATPPSSPDPVYIYEGIPSKDDEELTIALSLVNPVVLSQFGAVTEYLRHVRKVPECERLQWPSTDSPRAKRRRGI